MKCADVGWTSMPESWRSSAGAGMEGTVLVEAEDAGRGLARALLEDWATGCTDCASDCCLEQHVPMFRDFSVEF